MEIQQIGPWDREKFLTDLDSGKLLPSLSPVTVQLMRLSSDEDCSLAQIADLIEKDPSLTIRILKLANSAFFRSRQPTISVRNAVLRIGIYQTRLLALSLSLKDTFPFDRMGGIDYRHFWRLSLYQGLIARFLGARQDPEEAFSAAFTLEIGLLVFMRTVLKPKDTDEMPQYPLPLLLEWESARYGVNHREIGEILLAHWQFPPRVLLCQRSYQLDRAAAELPTLARICAIASHLSAFICRPQVRLTEVLETMENVFGLPAPLVMDVVILALLKIDSVAETFEMEMDAEKDRREVVKKARDALARLSQKILDGLHIKDDRPWVVDLQEEPRDGDVRQALEAIEHEVRNPLTVIGSFARRLSKIVDPTSDQGEYLRIIMAESARLEQKLASMSRSFLQSP